MANLLLLAVVIILICLVSAYQLNSLQLCINNACYYQRRKILSTTAVLIGHKINKRRKGRKRRRFWVRPGRTSAWWDNFVADVVVHEEWKENFRMSKQSFDKLCNELHPYIEKQQTNMRSPVDVRKQVALTLYYLADG